MLTNNPKTAKAVHELRRLENMFVFTQWTLLNHPPWTVDRLHLEDSWPYKSCLGSVIDPTQVSVTSWKYRSAAWLSRFALGQLVQTPAGWPNNNMLASADLPVPEPRVATKLPYKPLPLLPAPVGLIVALEVSPPSQPFGAVFSRKMHKLYFENVQQPGKWPRTLATRPGIFTLFSTLPSLFEVCWTLTLLVTSKDSSVGSFWWLTPPGTDILNRQTVEKKQQIARCNTPKIRKYLTMGIRRRSGIP